MTWKFTVVPLWFYQIMDEPHGDQRLCYSDKQTCLPYEKSLSSLCCVIKNNDKVLVAHIPHPCLLLPHQGGWCLCCFSVIVAVYFVVRKLLKSFSNTIYCSNHMRIIWDTINLSIISTGWKHSCSLHSYFIWTHSFIFLTLFAPSQCWKGIFLNMYDFELWQECPEKTNAHTERGEHAAGTTSNGLIFILLLIL